MKTNPEEPMGQNKSKSIAAERTNDEKDGRETASAISLGTGSLGAGARTIDFLTKKGTPRRPVKHEVAAEKPAPSRGCGAMVRKSSDIGDQIGRELRGMFDEIVAQPIPDRFMELLNRLETNTISGAKSKSPGERE